MRDLLGAGVLLAVTAAPAVARAQEAGPAALPDTDYVSLLFVFMLATFIGLGIITRVSRLLHTPLMSLTNAISAIAVVAGIQVMAEGKTTFNTVLCTLGVIAATTNIVGGFWITDRMLKMFRRETPNRD